MCAACWTWSRRTCSNALIARPPHTPFVDSWGSGQVELAPGEWLPGLNPLREADDGRGRSSATPAGRTWTTPRAWPTCAQQALRLREQGEFAIMGTPWLLFPFERAHAMQGMDVFLLNMAEDPDLAAALLRRITDSCKALMGNFLRECGDLLDIIKIGDDLGMQSGLLISPKMYRRMLKPLHAELIAFIKERTDAKIFFHTDGDVFDLIPDFIEIGIDILNPIQTSAGRMSNLACAEGALRPEHGLLRRDRHPPRAALRHAAGRARGSAPRHQTCWAPAAATCWPRCIRS